MHTLEQLRNGALAGARRLDLSCGLHELPPEVYGLADTLEVLNLSGNQLTRLPHDLPRLHRLRVVFCSNNPFIELPPVLGDCARLQMVGFKSCRIAQVDAASLPARLRWLILTDNAIVRLPRALGERPALQKLMLAGNRLHALPDSLAQANRLELLRLSANALGALPAWLATLPRLAWLALAGNPLGWHRTPAAPLQAVHWSDLQVGTLLGEGASGHIYRVQQHPQRSGLALKLFKGRVTSDGLPEHELAACLAAGQHPALCTPSGELVGHPEGARGMLLPLIPPHFVNLAAPPSLESCTRDVYAPGLRISASTALRLASQVAQAVAHLHARGVMHGDLYAHNILWDPRTAQALLGDLGGATLLPDASHPARNAMLALEVRAFGHLLEELRDLVECPSPDPDDAAMAGLVTLAQACTGLVPAQRPAMADVAAQLAALA